MIVFIYISCMVVANLTIAALGPWFSPINALLFIGLDMVLRDKLHDNWKGQHLYKKMFLLVMSASSISYILNPASGIIALASVVAFICSMAVITLVYQVIVRKKWLVRSNVSNVFGSAVDSVVFPTIAFGSLMLDIVVLQFIAKVFGGFLWSLVFNKKEK